jgi:Flp pilus assembly pilin Flp
VETHNEDPRDHLGVGDEDPQDEDPQIEDSQIEDPWQQATERWASVTDKLKDRYQEVVGDEGPSEDEVREALRTLGTAVQAVFDSLGTAMRDPEVRTQVKNAAAGFMAAIGQTFTDLGSELKRDRSADPETIDEA